MTRVEKVIALNKEIQALNIIHNNSILYYPLTEKMTELLKLVDVRSNDNIEFDEYTKQLCINDISDYIKRSKDPVPESLDTPESRIKYLEGMTDIFKHTCASVSKCFKVACEWYGVVIPLDTI